MRQRRKSSSGGLPPPLKRCSSASVASLDCSIRTSIGQNEDEDIDECVNNSFLERIRNMLRFDALNLKSTAMRNAKMLSSIDDHSSVSYIPHYGVDVCFTDEYHSSASKLEPYRLIAGDPEMDSLLSEFKSFGPFDDVIAAAAAACNDPTNDATDKLAQFYRHYEQVPSWVDFDQIQRGIDVFLAYLPAAGAALYYRSLVGGFSIPKIVEVLKSTRYLMSDRQKTLRRLVDTGGLLAACFAPTNGSLSAASLRPGGRGWLASLRVRVLHAKIRQRLLQLKRTSDDGHSVQSWDIEKNGIPINQEDMAATLLAFSVNVLLGIEILAGKPVPANEQLDYLALWRYIGWLLGIDTPESEDVSSNCDTSRKESLPPIDPCGPSILHAYASLESIILHILHPEPSSCDLVTHLLSVTGFFAFRAEVCRNLLGDPLADGLGLPKCYCWQGWRVDAIQIFVVNSLLKVAVYTFFMCFRVYTLLTMSCPWFKAKATVWHGNLQRKFLQKWVEGNSSRMKRMSVAYKTDKTASASVTKSSSCPFSMVMPPQL
eukprot:scaffold316_cov122-Skeletonema_dohrnii-CCMP3373.AAC.3